MIFLVFHDLCQVLCKIPLNLQLSDAFLMIEWVCGFLEKTPGWSTLLISSYWWGNEIHMTYSYLYCCSNVPALTRNSFRPAPVSFWHSPVIFSFLVFCLFPDFLALQDASGSSCVFPTPAVESAILQGALFTLIRKQYSKQTGVQGVLPETGYHCFQPLSVDRTRKCMYVYSFICT